MALKLALDTFLHPDEFVPVVQMILSDQRAKIAPKEPGRRFCYEQLNRVSRSFAIVIQKLPVELRDPVCVFYLVLRALDTVEDDMNIAKSIKVPLLRTFCDIIYDRSWSMDCGDAKYRTLMMQYPLVTQVFLSFTPGEKKVITDITRRMGNGMADFIDEGIPPTIADYDLYCHYVAGLVGIGVTELFVESGLESPSLLEEEGLSNHMGLFLQKTNIIRDYLEDINEEPAPRMFWPKEIWGKYANSLEDFKKPENRVAALKCLNHMVTDALRHGVFSLDYMAKVRDPRIFEFCAIPQAMAFATLSLCYNNPKVFQGVVKQRRGQAAKMMRFMKDMPALYRCFRDLAEKMEARCRTETCNDPSVAITLEHLRAIKHACISGLADSNLVSWDQHFTRYFSILFILSFLFPFHGKFTGMCACPSNLSLLLAGGVLILAVVFSAKDVPLPVIQQLLAICVFIAALVSYLQPLAWPRPVTA
uniref:squalene synthase n=1 Tax=Botryococcus braunii TaxID=38881 RepID=A0A172QBV7_BOTBR|nr:ayame triterpene biosynthesis protein 4 [Botryococcus braunii]